jgi:soluble lytic murein transglycosylase
MGRSFPFTRIKRIITGRYIPVIFLFFTFCVNSCAQNQIQNDFYYGLLLKNEAAQETSQEATQSALQKAVKLFEKSLTSGNVYIRQNAAEELANMMAQGEEFSSKTLNSIRKESAGPWAEAFDIITKNHNTEKLLDFVFGCENTQLHEDAHSFALLNHKTLKGNASPEMWIFQGRIAVSKNRYNEALQCFSVLQQDGQWPGVIPPLLLQYPELISDLGRAFQYSSSANEGFDLFTQWEQNLNNTETKAARFRLLFYAARIARRLGQNETAVSLFKRAVLYAPSPEQSDACFWYILDMSWNQESEVFISILAQYIRYWNDDVYFEDILEKLSRELVSKQKWKNIIDVFSLIKDSKNTVSIARYAWLIARAIEEGYLNNDEMNIAAAVLMSENATAADYMRIARNSGDASFYYLSMSAAFFKEKLLAEETQSDAKNEASAKLQFLLGFFEYNAAQFAAQYIQKLEDDLTINELRELAYAYEKAGMYPEAIRLTSKYCKREEYIFSIKDMKLMYPLVYRELTEKYARELNIEPAILFALIRTESMFQKDAISHAGAIGLTQLMSATAEETAGRIKRANNIDYYQDGPADLTDPEINIHIGAFYFNYLLNRFENTPLSLLAYNGGMNRVRRWREGNTLPVDLFLETVDISETREYGRKVMAAAAVYRELYYQN